MSEIKTYSSRPVGEESRLIACDLCGSGAFQPHWDCHEFAFVRCLGCGVIYQNPQPLADSVLKRYDQQYFDYEKSNEASFLQLMRLGLKDIGFDRRLGSAGQGRAFLDIGCATGMLLEEMKGKGWKVQGVEVCTASASWGSTQRGVEIFPGTLDEAGFPDKSFDVIHFSHLIEHVNFPRKFMAEVARLVKPAGWVLVTTPNTDGWQARWFGPQWRSAIADHLYLFSRSNLAQLLTSSGFQLRALRTWGGLARGLGHPLKKAILDRLVKVLGTGDVMMMAAQAPA